MRFSVFVPPRISDGVLPGVIFLSGLTCTEENFTTKAGAYKKAAECGLVIIAPDTSPRGKNVPDDPQFFIGQGASYYINATEPQWKTHFQMEQYILNDLISEVVDYFPLDPSRLGITGHSMGGHGALTLFLKHPESFRSVSAFSPLCAPTQSEWGRKAFAMYFGSDESIWQAHDATALMKARGSQRTSRPLILIDQGLADEFLESQLRPDLFEAACSSVNYPLRLRRHVGYDHSYFFVSSFIDEHLEHHRAHCVEHA